MRLTSMPLHMRRLLLGTTALTGFVALAPGAHAGQPGLPSGGVVASGTAKIGPVTGNQLSITTGGPRTVIDWQNFSIGAGDKVAIQQPGTSSITVNEVVGADPSQIFGELSSNGRVVLANPNGIWFGANSHVDVAGLVASTATLSPAAVKSFAAGGRLSLDTAGKATASIVNDGKITIANQGLAAFVAPGVRNDGIIQATLGTVQLSSGVTSTLDFYGDGLVSLAVTAPVTALAVGPDGKAFKTTVENKGTLSAAGGHVLVTADVVKGVVDNVINMSGVAEAKGVTVSGGDIVLDGGDGGVTVAGTVDVGGTKPGQTGGTVQVTGGTVTVAATAKIDASGAKGGGTVQLGGGPHGGGALHHATTTTVQAGASITANATQRGNGGTVSVWSDGQTTFDGSISARGAGAGNGGWVETSGHYLSITTGHVDTGAPTGLAGTWLLDPYNLSIVSSNANTTSFTSSASNSKVLASVVESSLASGNVDLQTGGSGGNITVSAGITWSSGTNLRLDTSLSGVGSIAIEGAITATNNGSLTLVSGGTVFQTQPIQVAQLELLGTGGNYALTSTANNIGTLSSNTGSLTIDNGGHALTIGTAGATTGIALTNALILLDLSGALTLNGNVSASSVDFTPSTTGSTGVSLATNVTIDTSAANGTIQLGPVDGAHALTLTAGTGSVSLSGNIGANTQLGSLSVDGGTITLPSAVTTTGTQSYQGALTVTGTTSLTVAGEGSINISGSLDGSGNSEAVTMAAGGNVSLTGTIGASQPIGQLIVDAGTITLNGSITTNGSAGQFYSGAITLSGDTVLTDNATGPISILSTIDGTQALTINTNGPVQLQGAIGSNTPLTTLNVTGSQITLSNSTSQSSSISTTSDQTYNGAVVIDSDMTLTSQTGNLNFHGTVDGFTNGGQSLTIVTAGAVAFDDAVGGTVEINQFSLTAASVTPNPPDVNANQTTITLTGAGGAPTTVDLSGNVTYTAGLANDTIILTGDTTITASSGSLVLNGTVDGASNLSLVDTGGNISLTGAIGGTTVLTSLTLQSGGLVTISAPVITSGAFLSHSQGGSLAHGFTLTSTGSITSQNSNVTIYTDADSDTTVGTTITIGGAVTANGIYLKAADQAFNDPGVIIVQGTAVLNNTEANAVADAGQADVVLYAGTGGTINLQAGMTIQASSGNIALIADTLNVADSPANISTPGFVIVAPASTTGTLSGGSNYTDVSNGQNGTSAILTGSLPSGVNESSIGVGTGTGTFSVPQTIITALSGSNGGVGQLQIGLPNMGAATDVDPVSQTLNFPITTTIYGGTIATSGAISATTLNFISGGAIDISSPITATNSFTATSSGPITLESVGSINFGSVVGQTASLVSNGGGDVTINGTIISANAGAGIDLSAADGGIVTAAGSLLQTPGFVLLSGNGITLDGNVTAGTIQAHSIGSIEIDGQLFNPQSVGSITLQSTNEGGQVTTGDGSSIAAGGLTITGPGGVVINGSTSATTASFVSSSGDIDLEGPLTTQNGVSIVANAGSVTIANILDIGGALHAQFGNSLSLTAEGSITAGGSVVVSPTQGTSNLQIDIAGTITAQGIDISAIGPSPSSAGRITLESTAVLHNTEAGANNSASSADLVLYTGPGSQGQLIFNAGATVEADSGNIAFITDHFTLSGSGASTIATPGTVIYTPATTTGAFTGPSSSFNVSGDTFGVSVDIGTSATVVSQTLINLLSGTGGSVGTLQIGLPGTFNTTSISSTATFPVNAVIYAGGINLNGDNQDGNTLVAGDGALSLIANGSFNANSAVIQTAGVFDATFRNEQSFELDSGSSISSSAGVVIHTQSTGGDIEIDGRISAPEILLLASDHQSSTGGTITLGSTAVLTNTLSAGVNNAADHADTVLYAGPGGTITLQGGFNSGATINGGAANVALIADTLNVNVDSDERVIAISTSGRLIVSPGSTDGQLFTSLAVPDPYTTGSNVDSANYPVTLLGLVVPGGGSVDSVSIAGTGSDNVDFSQNLINNLLTTNPGTGIGNHGTGVGTLQIGLRGNSARLDIFSVNLPVSTEFYSGTIDVQPGVTVSNSSTQAIGGTPVLSFFSTEQLGTSSSGLIFEEGSSIQAAGTVILGSDCAIDQCAFSAAPVSSFAGFIQGSNIIYRSAADADHGIAGDQVTFTGLAFLTAFGNPSDGNAGIAIQTGRGGSVTIDGGASFSSGGGTLAFNTDTLLVPGTPVISTAGLLLGSGTNGNIALDAAGHLEAVPTIALGGSYVSAGDLGRLTSAISNSTPLTIGDTTFTPVDVTVTGTLTLPQTNVTFVTSALGGTGTISADNVTLTSKGDMDVDASLSLTGKLDVSLTSGSGYPQSFTQGVGSTFSAAGGVLLDYSSPADPTIAIHGTITAPDIYLLAADGVNETGSIELFGTAKLINTKTTGVSTASNIAYTILYTGSNGTVVIDSGATIDGGISNIALVSDHLTVASSTTTDVSTTARLIITPATTDAVLRGDSASAGALPGYDGTNNYLIPPGSVSAENAASVSINSNTGVLQLSGAGLALLGNSVGLLQIGLDGNSADILFAGSTALSTQTTVYGSSFEFQNGASLTVANGATSNFSGSNQPAGLTFVMDLNSTSDENIVTAGAGSVISAPGDIRFQHNCGSFPACGTAPTASFGGSITTGQVFAYQGTNDLVTVQQGAVIRSTSTNNQVGGVDFVAGGLALDGSLQTAGVAVLLNAPVTIDGGKTGTITTAGVGGVVQFDQTVDGPGALVVNAPAASVTEDAAIGGTTPLNSLSITATAITLNAETLTSGNQTYIGAVSLPGSTSLTSSGGSIRFEGTVDSADNAEPLTVVAQQNVEFDGTVGGNTSLTTLQVIAGHILLGSAVTTSGSQTYLGPVVLLENVSLNSTDDSVIFSGTINGTTAGQQALTVSASDTVTLGGAVGGATPLASLTISGDQVQLDGNVTTTGTQNYSGPVFVLADSTVTSTIGGIDFDNTIDGATSGGQSLTISSAQAVTLAGVIGGQTPLDNFTLTAPSVSGNLPSIHVTGTQTINVATAAFGGNYSFDSFVDNGAFVLSADTVITATAGDIDITGQISGSHALTLNDAVGTVSVTGSVDPNAILTSLTITASHGIVLGGTITTTGSQTYNGPTTFPGGTYVAGTSFEVTGAATMTGAPSITAAGITFNSTIDGAAQLTLNAVNGSTVTAGNIGSQTALTSLTLAGDGSAASFGNVATGQFVDTRASGSLGVAGDLVTPSYVANPQNSVLISIDGSFGPTSGPVSLAGELNFTNAMDFSSEAITLAGATILDTSAGNNPLVLGTVDGAFDLTLNAGAGSVTAGLIGSQTALASLTVTGGAISMVGAATTGAQTFNGTLGLSGAYTADSFIANGATQLTGAVIVTATGNGGIAFGTIDGPADLTIDAGPGSAVTGLIGGQTALGNLTITGSTIIVPGATTTGAQSYNGGLELGGTYTAASFAANGATQLTDATSVTVAEGNISFGTIDGPFDLTLNGGSAAVSTGVVGGQTALTSLTVAGGTITVPGATTTGDQTYTGALNLGGSYSANAFAANGPTQLLGATTVTAGDGAIAFGTVDGGFDLTLAGTGAVSTGIVGGQTALASLTVTGGTISVPDVTTTGAQTYSGPLDLGGTYTAGSFTANGPTQLTGATTVTAAGGAITVGTVDGGFDLALDAGSGTVSTGIVGGQTALASLTVTGGTISVSDVTTTGAQTYFGTLDLGGAYTASSFTANGPTQLTGATTVSAAAGDITIGTVDGGFDLNLNAGTGTVSTGIVGGQTALASLTVTGGTIIAAGATTTGAQDYAGALDLGGAYAASGFTVNGPTQLTGSATVSGGSGGITFGTVDGGFDLTLAGTGAVATGVVGGQTALASLTATGSAIIVPDVTTTGAQTYSGPLDLGGTYTAGSFTANGPTQLTGATTVSTGNGGITFGRIDGAFALTLGAGTVTAGTVGGQTALSSITLDNDGSAVGFTGDVAVNQFVDTRNAGTLSIAGNLLTSSYVANAEGSVLITLGGSLGLPTGGALSISGALNFANAVDLSFQTLTLTGATVLDTSVNGSALTLGTVDGGFDLSLNAGSGAVSAGVVGSQTPLNSLAIQGGTIALGSVTTTGAQNYSGALDLGGAYVASSFVAAGPTQLALDTTVTTRSGNIVFGSVDGGAILVLDAGTAAVTTGAMGSQTPLESVAIHAGTIGVGSVATLGAQTYDGALALGGTYTASDFTVAGATQLTGTTAVTADQAGIVLGTVDGAFGLTLNAGTGSVVTGAIGTQTALSSLTLAGINDAVTITGNAVTNQLVDTRAAGSLAISGNLVTGSYAALTNSDVTIDVTGGFGPTTGALAIAGTLNFRNAVDLGSHALTLSGTTAIDTSGGNALTLGTIDGAFGLTLDAGGGAVTVGRIGAQTALASLTLAGNGSAITLGGINGVAADVTGAPTSFGVSTGQLVDQRSSGSLAILGGLSTSGFTEAASNSVRVTVDGALGTGALTLAGQFNLVNALNIGSRAVTLTGATVLDTSANNGALTLGSVDGNFGLTLKAGTAAVALQGAAGANAALANLTINARSISLGSVSTVGAQVYNGTTSFNGTYRGTSFTTNGADLLSGNTGILATGGNIVIGGTLNGADALVLTDANGLVTFGGPVGGLVALTSLTVTANGIVAGAVTTAGAQSYAGAMSFSGNFTANGFTTSGPLVMLADTTVNGGTGDITFDGSIAGQHTLSLLSSDANIFFNGTAGLQTNRLTLLSIAGANNVTVGTDPATGSTYSLWVTDFTGNINGGFRFGDRSLESDDVVTIQASSVDGRVISTSATISAGNVSGIIQGDTVSVTATGAVNDQITAGAATISSASFSGSVSGTRSVTLTSGVVSDASITSAGLAKITASQSISADVSGGSVEVDAKTADVSGTITAVGGGNINITANNLTSTITNPGNATTLGGAINITANNVNSTISDQGGPITINAKNVGGTISDAGGPITITATNVDSTISDKGGPITINASTVGGNISDTGGPIVINGNQVFASVSNINGPITINGNDVGGTIVDQNGLVTINGNSITSTISDQGGQIVLNGPNVNPNIVQPGLALIINGNPVDPTTFENAAEAAAAGITQAVLGVTQQVASIGDDAANGPQGASGEDDSSQGDSSDDSSSGDGDKKKKKDQAKGGDATYDFANQYIEKLISGKGPKTP